MSKKNRLNERTIRRFMGLSGIGALGESFVDRIREEEDLPPEEELGAEAPVGDEVPVDDVAGPPVEGDVEVATEMATDVADAVAAALSDVLGQHGVEVTSGEATPEAEVAPAPEEEPADLGADLGAEEELPPEEEEEGELGDLEEAGIELIDDDHLVQEVARRVAARLMQENKGTSRKGSRAPRRTSRTRRPRR